jgi:hypothetical protein
VPDFPLDTALLGVVGAVVAVALKIFLGKKRKDNAPLVPKPPPTDTKVHAAATKVVTDNFREETQAIADANADTDEVERLDRLAGLANKGRRK